MTVVSNSSALISLGSVGKIDILQGLFGTVVIPAAVDTEVFHSSPGRSTGTRPGFIAVEKIKDVALVKLLKRELGAGESEAIALSMERGFPKIILDDKKARKTADGLGLQVIGTVGLLILAKEKGLVSEIRPLISEMQRAIGFRIADSVLNAALGHVKDAPPRTKRPRS